MSTALENFSYMLVAVAFNWYRLCRL